MPGSEPELILSLCNVSAGYHKKRVLYNVGCDVFQGDIVAILGANGSGKSTLFKAILGLVDHIEGNILFRNENIRGKAQHRTIHKGISYLPQDRNVFTSLSVQENLRLAGFGAKDHTQFQSEILELFPEIKSAMIKRVGLLSGGERQTLAVAMALIRKPMLVMLDEPSAGLSPRLAKRVMDIIKELNRKHCVSFLIIEQNIKAVLDIATKVLVMKNGGLKEKHDFGNLLLQENLKEIFFS